MVNPMKILVTEEWCLRVAELEEDCEIGACSPAIADGARALAASRGFDPDQTVYGAGGHPMPLWQLFVDETAMSRVVAP
jgi:hypothetical protein